MTNRAKTTRLNIDLDGIDLDNWVEEPNIVEPIVTIIGGPGIGKSRLGVSQERPVIIMGESGVYDATVPKLPAKGKLESWLDAMECLRFLGRTKHNRKTVVVDVINAVADLCRVHTCENHFEGVWTAPSGNSYDAFGKGDKAALVEFKKFLGALDFLRRSRGMRVLVLVHEGLQRQGNIYGDDYQKIGGAMPKAFWDELLRVSDLVGHATQPRDIVKGRGKFDKAKVKPTKRQGSDRIVDFTTCPGLDVKTRQGWEVPNVVPLHASAPAKALDDAIARCMESQRGVAVQPAKAKPAPPSEPPSFEADRDTFPPPKKQPSAKAKKHLDNMNQRAAKNSFDIFGKIETKEESGTNV